MKASASDGIVFYRIVVSNPPAEDDFKTYFGTRP
jgi:hypothetical protein